MTNSYVLSKVKSAYAEEIKKRNLVVHKIIGNHDCYYANTNKINTPEEHLRFYENIKIYTGPEYVDIGDRTFLMLPWINSENYDISLSHIREGVASVVVGHLALTGFPMPGSQVCNDGMNPKEFEIYDLVMTGHFHNRSRKGNIHYIGNPFWSKWNEYGDDRGFAILDTKTLEIEYVNNRKYQMFVDFVYDEDNLNENFDDVTNKYVRVNIHNKKSEVTFEDWTDKLRSNSPQSIVFELPFKRTIEVNEEQLEDDEEDQKINVRDTFWHMMKYVDESKDVEEKIEIKQLLSQIYDRSHA